jgi:hypothetical protein
MTPIGTPRNSRTRSFGVVKEKGIRVSKPSHAFVSLLRHADGTRERPLRANGSGTRAARLTGLLAIGLLALSMVPALASAAVPAHPFKEIFGSLAHPELEHLAGIAIDPSTGDVYVIDLADHTLHRYTSNGAPAPFSALGASNVIDGASGADEVPGVKQILATEVEYNSTEVEVAVAPPGSAGGTAGDIYVTSANDGQIDVFASSGTYVGKESSSFPCGVSVGPEGDVYVGDYVDGVYKLIPTAPGTFSNAEKSPFSAPEACNVAAGSGSSDGSVFYNEYGKAFFKLDASTGDPDYEVFDGGTFFQGGMTVDPATGHLYVDQDGESPAVKEFDVSGASEATEVSSTTLAKEPLGVAVGATGNVYAALAGSWRLEVFKPFTRALTITTVEPGTVECRAEGSVSFETCEAGYAEDHVVTLKEDPGAHFSFGDWSEFSGSGTVAVPCSGMVEECEIRLDADVTGKATFIPNPQVTLTVDKSGAGSGAVTTVPGGIECGPVCEAEYETGAIVTLEATAAPGSTFAEWAGCDSVSGPVCHVTMGAAKAVSAVFAIAQHSVTVGGDTAVTATFDKKPAESAPPAPPPPPVPGVGEARVAGGVLHVSANLASVKLNCVGAGACKGVLELYASVPQGKKHRKVTRLIGESSFSIGRGESATVKIKLANNQVAKELNKGHTVKAQAKGTGIKSAALTLKSEHKRHAAGGKH